MEFTESSGDRVIINFEKVCSILEHKGLNESVVVFDSGTSRLYDVSYEELSKAFNEYCASKSYFTQPFQYGPYGLFNQVGSWKDPTTGNPPIYCGNISNKVDK